MADISAPALTLTIDSTQAKRGADDFKRAVDDAAAAGRGLGTATRGASDEFQAFATRINPALRATLDFKDAERLLNAEFERGGISIRTYTEYLGRAKAQFESAASAASPLNRIVRELGTGLAAGIGFGSALGLAELIKGFVGSADAAQRLQNQIHLAAGATGDSSSAFRGLYDIAQRTGSSMESLATLFSRVTIAATELHASQDRVLKVTEAVGNAIRIAGQTPEQAAGAMLQFSQAIGSGVVRAEEFNSMLEGMLPLVRAAAQHIDGAGGSVAKLRQMVIDGKLSSEDFFHAIELGAADLSQAAGSMEQTMGQALTGMGNALTRFVGDLDQAIGTTHGFKSAISGISGVLDQISVAIEASAGNIDSQIELQKKRIQSLTEVAKLNESIATKLSSTLGSGAGNLFKSLGFEGTGGSSLTSAQKELERLQGDQTAAAIASAGEQSRLAAYNASLRVPQADIGDSIDLQRRQLALVKDRASAEDDLAKKRALLVQAAQKELEITKAQIAIDKNLRPSERGAATALAEQQYQTDVRRIDQQIGRSGSRSARSAETAATRDRNRALADERALATEAKRQETERNSDLAQVEQFSLKNLEDRDSQLEKIELERTRMLEKLASLNTLTPEERASAKLDIEGATADKHRQLLERQNQVDVQRQDLLDRSAAASLTSRAGRTGVTPEESADLQIQAIERRRAIELRSIDEVADRYKLSEQEKRELIAETNDEFDSQISKAKDLGDSFGTAITEGLSGLQSTISSVFADILTGGEVTAASIGKSITRSLVQQGLQSLGGEVFGQAGGGAKGSTGLVGSILKSGSLSRLFGGDGIRVSSSSGAGSARVNGADYAISGFGSVDALDKSIAAGGDITGGTGSDQLAGSASALSGAADDIDSTFQNVGDSLIGVGEGMANALGGAAAGMASSIGGAAGGMVRILAVAAQALVTAVSAASGSSGAAGAAGGLFGALGALFGGSSTSGFGGSTYAGMSGVDSTGAISTTAAFARGGVIDRPVIFPMAKGLGLAGEAGYEGVLPLRRTASGDLGVQVAGGGGGGVVINPTTNITVQTQPGADSHAIASETAAATRRAIEDSVKAVLATEMRSGGMLRPGLKAY